MASVEIQTPEGVMRVRLDRDHFTIGRLSSNDIALPYPHISRHHAELRRNGQTWWVVDAKSTNGLHVGAQRVSESRLTPGAVVMLSPQVALTLLEETAPGYPQPQPQVALPSQPGYPPPPAFNQQPSPYPQQPAGYPQPPVAYPPQPSAPSYYSAPSQAPAHEQIAPLSELGPRSPYADDEAPYYPQMRQRQPTQTIQHPLYPPHGPAAPLPFDRRPQPPTPPRSEPAPAMLDPQRQAAQIFEQRRTAFAPPSPLLHVCQTCGQRTAPDAVYCQNCHHSIASECARCRLTLLPVQDLCPRCQTPNPYAVRRFHRAAE
ncbi:MAG TPA: FHA domain-containing protein [Ktedonobacterales bacterium]